MAPPLRSSTLRDLFFWIAGRYRRYRVTGYSMAPLLSPGNEVLLDGAAYKQSSPKAKDIVVTSHPQQPTLRIIKRIEFVTPDGYCCLSGDNRQASSDSREFGLIHQTELEGRVVCRFP